VPLLVYLWGDCVSSRPVARLEIVLLISPTCSYVWLLLCMMFPSVFGESYGTSRFVTIDANFVVMFGCSIAAFWLGRKRKPLLGIVCVLLTLLWSIVGAINSVV